VTRFIFVSANGIKDEGGVERMAGYWVRLLSQKREVSILSLERAPWLRYLPGPLCSLLYPLVFGFSVFFERMMSSRSDLWIVTNGGQAGFARTDIAISHGTVAGYIHAMKGVRTFRSYHLIKLFEYAAFNRARRIIAVSENARQELIRFYRVDPSKINVINNCVDCTNFVVQPRRPGPFILLFVGRLEDGKGLAFLDRLGRALDARAGEDLQLTLVTPNRINTHLFAERRNVNLRIGVSFQEMPGTYAEASLLIIPSFYEGFEMVTLEALACGCPVAGRAVGAIGELAGRGFIGCRTFEFFEEGFRDEHLEALLHFAQSCERSAVAAAARSGFSIESYLQKVCEAIPDLAPSREPDPERPGREVVG
jgi:glycosyltransferase involved in cell wall biosynthesis